jgi:hypothetical protein
MKDLRFTIGFILVLLTSVACGISAFLWIIAVPVFVIGVILILISKKTVKTKLLAAFAPFIIIVAGASLYWHFSSKTVAETYIIPSDFQGRFRVVYGEPCGVQPAVEDGRRVLEIPASGILIIAPEFEAGIIDHKYFFVDESGKRTLDESNTITIESTGSTTTETGGEIKYADFFVGDPAAITVLTQDDFNAATVTVVEACRKK